MSVTFLAHETGHVFGLEHSFDQSDRKDADWSAPGEYYDKYDIMSAMNVYTVNNQKFGKCGPLLCTANLDYMGWLQDSRVWKNPTTNSSFTDEFELVSMSAPEIPGYIAARVGGLYIEFRTREGWDGHINRPAILIHQLSGGNALIMASDKTKYINDWQPGQVFGPADLVMLIQGGTQIFIESFDLQAKKARIRVRVVARRELVDGPGQVFGGVANDGGGFIFINGRIIRIPPNNPLRGIVEEVANILNVESFSVYGARSYLNANKENR